MSDERDKFFYEKIVKLEDRVEYLSTITFILWLILIFGMAIVIVLVAFSRL